jgi:Zn ribbon nucleic-acid-binding protein
VTHYPAMALETIEPFRYDGKKTPAGYKCTKCGATDLKLWRYYNAFVSHQELFCVDCGLARDYQGGPKTTEVAEDGTHDFYGMRSTELNGLIPAVPTEDGETFWGFSSVPGDGVAWWKTLPLRAWLSRNGEPGQPPQGRFGGRGGRGGRS